MARKTEIAEPTETIGLKAPVDWFERLDHWREAQWQKPTRQASIRWIVHNFLEQQQQQQGARRRRRTPQREPDAA